MLIEALRDPVPGVRLQAAKALGRVRDPSALPALLNTLQGADEQLGSQIFSALVQIGPDAVPALIQASTSSSAWMRWQCIRALGDIRDRRAIPVLVNALRDIDHSVTWVAAKGLVHYGRLSVIPVLRLLTTAAATPWLVETASYVLQNQCQYRPKLRPYLEPVLQQMHSVAYREGIPTVAHKALTELIADGVIED